MEILLKNVQIIDPNSEFNKQQKDLLIVDGIISKIGTNLTSEGKNIKGENLCISPGWVDFQVNFCDPGFEYKEDLQSGLKCAIKGGFTGVGVMPTTLPVVDTKSSIAYLLNKSKGNLVDVFPIGSVTEKAEGNAIAEMADMKNTGAVAFSDNKNTINNPDVLKKALLYVKNLDTPILSFCSDYQMSKRGQMNEGISSTQLGLKGIPALAEELAVARDIALAEYTESKIHLLAISTAKSVELVREAKKKGITVTCGVVISNLVLDDTVLSDFNSHYKILPPLRTPADIVALKEGLKDGTIDVITSDHTPEDVEHKNLEFERAAFGAIGLESCFALYNKYLADLGLEIFVKSTAINSRKIFNQSIPVIAEKQKANLTIFSTDTNWTYTSKKSVSKSENTPFFGTEFTSKVIGVINKNKLELTDV